MNFPTAGRSTKTQGTMLELISVRRPGLEMEPTGEAEEREAKEQLATANGGRGVREAGFNCQQLEIQSQLRKGLRDFLKDL